MGYVIGAGVVVKILKYAAAARHALRAILAMNLAIFPHCTLNDFLSCKTDCEFNPKNCTDHTINSHQGELTQLYVTANHYDLK